MKPAADLISARPGSENQFMIITTIGCGSTQSILYPDQKLRSFNRKL